jgi:uncharacterized Zn finger protein
MVCGIAQVHEASLDIVALVLSSTSPTDKMPHIVKVQVIEIKEDDEDICDVGKTECNCKAGSHKCKHVYAVLLKLQQ